MSLRFVILILILGLQISCSRTLTQENVRWSGQGTAPVFPQGVESSFKSSPVMSYGDSQLSFQLQTVDGVEVDGSYAKKIEKNGAPEFITYSWIKEVPVSVHLQLIKMKTEKVFIKSRFFKTYKALADLSNQIVGSPEIFLNKNLEANWRFTFQNKEGALFAIYTDENLKIQKQEFLGSQFVDGLGALFPNGPLKSDLQSVVLHNLLGNQTLSSSSIKVNTQSDKVAVSENNQFLFPVEDGRFEQVQVFYYLSQTAAWFQKNMNFTLPFLLEAETSVGFPEKTNAAFYYQHKIRLGDGDGEVFSKIPLDPSIVIHESVHAVVEAVAHLPYQGEGGSLNEAFADYFATVQLNNPNMGEASYKLGPFKRTVDNGLKLSDKNGGLYHDSGIISGLLWNIQKEIGAVEANKIAWNTLVRLTPQSNINDFLTEIHSVIETLEPQLKVKVLNILKKRGWDE